LPSERYVGALLAAAEQQQGRALNAGTTIVIDPERDGSGTASCYPTPHGSIVWCDAAVKGRLAALDVSQALSAHEFVEMATVLGGSVIGFGHIRVLDGDVQRPASSTDGLHVRHVPDGEEIPVDLLADMADACDADDVDAADLDLDHLDPTYTLVVAPDGSIAAYASARPADLDPSFDDIAVLTHPARRGRRLGAFAVHEFVRRRVADGHHMLYRCNVDNLASNRLVDSLGFTLVTTIGAVRF